MDDPERGGWAERCSAAAASARAEPEGSDEGESEPTAARERRGGRRDGEKGANQEPPRNEAEPRPSPSRKKEAGAAGRPAKGEKGRGERRDRRRLGEHPERRNGKPSRAAAAKGRSETPRKRARARAWHWARWRPPRRVDGSEGAGWATPQGQQKRPYGAPHGEFTGAVAGNSTAVLPYGRSTPTEQGAGFTNGNTAVHVHIQLETPAAPTSNTTVNLRL